MQSDRRTANIDRDALSLIFERVSLFEIIFDVIYADKI
jgi:hypothetical protein